MTGWGVPTGIEPRLAENYEHQFKFLQVVVLEDYTGEFSETSCSCVITSLA